MSNRLFEQVPVPKFPSSTFSLSREVEFTPRYQKLYAPNIVEILPGDGINESSEQFARTQPMVAPTFARSNADQFAFFVPRWQINEHFDEFITGGDKGDYNQKMPWTTVAQIFSVVRCLLAYNDEQGDATSAQSWDELFTDYPSTKEVYLQLLERAQSIIEHCDLLRSVPFTLPDFIFSSDPDAAAGNYNAFISLNGNFADVELRVNLCPFVAYLKVWCEYFRDENLCEDYIDTLIKHNNYGAVDYFTAVGFHNIDDFIDYQGIDWFNDDQLLPYSKALCAFLGVLPRAWKKDYFTAALPFTQKGPEVLLPLSGTFPVEFGSSSSGIMLNQAVVANRPGSTDPIELSANSKKIEGSVALGASGLGSTIQDVRRAFKLEEFYEADARGGNRYPENTLMQWGVRTPDSRLPRCIFLGSNTSLVQISEVAQTSATTQDTSPQGTLAGKGVSYGNNRLSKYFYTMHGFLINLYSARTTAVYEQGIHPMFSRFDRTEYAWPRFAHLGEQPVYTKELYIDGVDEDEVFGYEPRYSEYKSEKSSVHGLLKGSLNFWTMSRRFGSKPVLNEEFIYGAPRLDNFAVTNPLQPPFIATIFYRVRANRKLPFFGVPML